MRVRVGAPVWLPDGRPSVLAVVLEDLEGAFARLQGAVADALVVGGWYERERRPYMPHVTVARVRRGERVSRRAAVDPPPAVEFEAATVALYRSRPGQGGARYEVLACVELAGEGQAR
jgi:2'-5' RNA ligase